MKRFFDSPAGRLLSGALLLLALAFLLRALLSQGSEGLLRALAAMDWTVALLCAAGYGGALALLGYAWARAAAGLAGEAGANVWPAVRIYAVTTLAKYLPGNVFHFAGRQLAAVRCGWPQWAVAKATLYEALLHLAVVGVMAVVLLPFVALPEAAWHEGGRFAGSLPAVLAIPALVLSLAGLYVSRRTVSSLIAEVRALLLSLLLLQTAFFLGSLLLHLWLASSLSLLSAGVPLFAVAFLLSWLAGFVVPGAPGGLGVREAVLVAVLSAYLPAADVLAFAVVSRCVTTLGEALFALCVGLAISPGREAGGAPNAG